ncbi:bacterial transcriptional activator domain-containing protein [Streptomyces galilaeus]|uniref:bacterial transcriptional activator domain-containing protein n=1 Tax=Streptomyces galilaeus TaxID=33899 RepID=UPI0038F6B9E6
MQVKGTFRVSDQLLDSPPRESARLAAAAIDPIRETAHRIIIEIHLSEGNVASAVRCYQHYEAYLQQELGVSPSPHMTDLLEGVPGLGGDRDRQQSMPKQTPVSRPDRLRRQVNGSHARNEAATLSSHPGQHRNDAPGRK